ncbi:hypothetical protein GQ600_12373 [Phytophthora cactorum]|nr:hypothetical protein GQ600_12373 [Phytophthora cactorum]
MSSQWGGWGTKLNVTSIVSQGLEQVRSLREDVEKSFDQVVTGAPGARVPLPQAAAIKTSGEQIEDTITDNEADETKLEVGETLLGDKANPNELLEEKAGAAAVVIEKPEEPKDGAAIETTQGEQEGETQEVQKEAKQEEEDDVDTLEEQPGAQQHIEDQSEEETEADAEVEDGMGEKTPEVEMSDTDAGEDEEEEEKEVEEKEEEEKEEKEAVEGDDVSEDVAALRKELEVRESQLLATSATIQELHDELDKTCHREVAAVERAQFLTEQLENMRHEVAKLTQLHRDTSSSQSADVQALQVALAEKEEKLSGLLDEGQALSVKQAQLEQRLRTLRKEKDELEERALKLQSQCESSTQEVKDLASKLKASEEEKTRLAQENRQLTSSADTTSVKVEKAERIAQEATQQLEKLQTQVEQLTQEVSRKNDEIERLKTATKSNEALSLEKEELHHTIQFLQDNIRDLEKEAARREEMARVEIADLKRKWQDAVGRVDMLGLSVSEATQPLLRQIHTLQEEQRTRQECWKTTESTLLAQIEEATEQRRAVEQEKLGMEQELQELERKVEESELKLLGNRQRWIAHKKKGEPSTSATRGGSKQQLQTRLDNAEKSSKKLEALATATAELEQARSTSSQLYARRSIDSEQLNGSDGTLSSEASILKTTLEQQWETRSARMEITRRSWDSANCSSDCVYRAVSTARADSVRTSEIEEHQVVLLELFGEKEEQVEELQAEQKQREEQQH